MSEDMSALGELASMLQKCCVDIAWGWGSGCKWEELSIGRQVGSRGHAVSGHRVESFLLG